MARLLKIAEIFESIQGEGGRMGTPSLFIRVSGCNLRCVWCDTPYASWNPEGDLIEVSELLKRAKESKLTDVVITGGEPMIFAPVVELTKGLKGLGKFVTIETAGTKFQDLPADLLSISPKLSNSTPVGTPEEAKHELLRADLTPLKQLIKIGNFQLKFVVGADPENPTSLQTDIEEIEGILAQVGPVSPENVFLMPEGRSSAMLWQRARHLVPLCMAKGWRLAPRLQIDLFGDTRGT